MSRFPFNPTGIDHVVLRVPDLPVAEAFWSRVLGAYEERRLPHARMVQMRVGSGLVDLIEAGEVPPAAGPSRVLDHVCIRLEPFDEAVLREHLARHGIAIDEDGLRYGAEGLGPSIYIRDPFGTVVELKGPPVPVEQDEPLLRTARLVLRPTRMSDAPALMKLFTDPETMRFWSHLPIETLDEMRAIIARNLPPQNQASSSFVVTTDGGEAFGCFNVHEHHDGMAGVGYILDRARWGQGLATEALGRIVEHAFVTLKLNRLWLEMHPGNAGSARIAQKCGFQAEGIQRQSFLMNGSYQDTLFFGMLYEDWLSRNAGATTSGQ